MFVFKNIVDTISGKNSKKFVQFESDIKAAYTNFVAENFTEFISSMGGFTDISAYVSHIKYHNETSFLGLATAALGIVAAGMVWHSWVR